MPGNGRKMTEKEKVMKGANRALMRDAGKRHGCVVKRTKKGKKVQRDKVQKTKDNRKKMSNDL